MIGVHAPEFAFEQDPVRVRAAARRFKMDFPHLIDNDFNYWSKLKNRAWPTFYVVDRAGRIRLVHIGETHPGTERAATVERLIEKLLSEPA